MKPRDRHGSSHRLDVYFSLSKHNSAPHSKPRLCRTSRSKERHGFQSELGRGFHIRSVSIIEHHMFTGYMPLIEFTVVTKAQMISVGYPGLLMRDMWKALRVPCYEMLRPYFSALPSEAQGGVIMHERSCLD